MYGRSFYRWCYAVTLSLLGVAGCAHSTAGPPCRSTACFDSEAAGSMEGRVLWAGDLPCAVPFPHRLPAGLTDESKVRSRPYTFLPAVDSYSRGVSGAVVYLRGINPHEARPWDHPPVTVEQSDLQLRVLQGDRDGQIGFVRRGDAITMVSRDRRFHSLRAQGSAWFTLAFPDADQPLSRSLDEIGLVELTSGAGYYWMRAYLLVDDHPYYTLTDKDGRFALPGLPPGRYEIVCWLPNWRESGHDRDPETGRVTRVSFAEPVTIKHAVEVEAKGVARACFELSAVDFERSNLYVKR